MSLGALAGGSLSFPACITQPQSERIPAWPVRPAPHFGACTSIPMELDGERPWHQVHASRWAEPSLSTAPLPLL